MSDVLIRDVPGDDLDLIRATAAELGVSLQSYLRSALQDQATHLRRRQALAGLDQRMSGRPPVPEEERAAVLDAVAAADVDRADELVGPGRSAPPS